MALRFDEALQTIAERTVPTQTIQTLLLSEAQGRILASDVVARRDLPPFDNAAMDGYAFSASYAGEALRVSRSVYAGDRVGISLEPHTCCKIMTGAPLPDNADTVVPKELCRTDGKRVFIPSEIPQGSHIRRKGEEIRRGDVILRAGHRLRYGDIALLSAQGMLAVEVYAPVRTVIVATGSEIKEPWQEASSHEIYNANAFGLKALLKHYGFEADYFGALPDEKADMIKILSHLGTYDMIISTGGISKGDKDFVYDAFAANGLEEWFYGVALKPGKGVMFGRMGRSYVAALPGNPLATMLTAHAFVIPALRKAAGARAWNHTSLRVPLGCDIQAKPGRTELVLGRIDKGAFVPVRRHIGSAMLSPLSESTAVARIETSHETCKAGSEVPIVLLYDTTQSVASH